MGLIFGFMLHRFKNFQNCTVALEIRSVWKHTPNLVLPKDVQGNNLIENLLIVNPRERLSAKRARQHEWLPQYKENQSKGRMTSRKTVAGVKQAVKIYEARPPSPTKRKRVDTAEAITRHLKKGKTDPQAPSKTEKHSVTTAKGKLRGAGRK
ncbi:hypothetical protein FRB95_013827 [Tulasnella sp. JGI-2019a]|nr:hypothetical protein FRB93_007437 [Tulasnella sp. JGI-2019a]KAG9034058.1 hypothetical protein FRB95_013827 [Tulasnella sp. JGI-2019a]